MEDNIWTKVVHVLNNKHTDEVRRLWRFIKFNTWDEDTQTLSLFIHDGLKLDRLKKHYPHEIEDILKQLGYPTASVLFEIKETEQTSPFNFTVVPNSDTAPSSDPQKNITHTPTRNPSGRTDKDKQLFQHHDNDLIPHYTFENFVQGDSNRFAISAAYQVVADPGNPIANPLFLFGCSGLGKTHLMTAIGHELLRQKKVSRVRFVSANTFMNDYIHAMKSNLLHLFREYYNNLDLLLLDDIQNFSKREKTAEEFVSIYEYLIRSKGQIVVTSDTYPTNIDSVPKNLQTRLQAGCIVTFEPPPFEERCAILEKKLENPNYENIRLTQDAIFYIANHITKNVRELEGALNTLRFKATFGHSRIITLDLGDVKHYLQDTIKHQAAHHVSIDNIIQAVANWFDLKPNEILSKHRKKAINHARQVAMYLCRELTSNSYADIGKAFGRDHSTVMHACNSIIEQKESDSQFNLLLKALAQTIKG